MTGYVVAVKSSARKHSRGAGEWVVAHGPHRRFETKAAARDWATALSSDADATLWVQDAPRASVDGYLVAGPRHRRRGEDVEQTALYRF